MNKYSDPSKTNFEYLAWEEEPCSGEMKIFLNQISGKQPIGGKRLYDWANDLQDQHRKAIRFARAHLKRGPRKRLDKLLEGK